MLAYLWTLQLRSVSERSEIYLCVGKSRWADAVQFVVASHSVLFGPSPLAPVGIAETPMAAVPSAWRDCCGFALGVFHLRKNVVLPRRLSAAAFAQ
jgi:hypothetical protein